MSVLLDVMSSASGCTVFIKLFCKSQFPHKSVNLFFILVIIKDKLTDLCGNLLLRKDFINTFWEIRSPGKEWSKRVRRVQFGGQHLCCVWEANA